MMVFFILTVFLSIAYVYFYSGISHYLGHQKHMAETLAFILSGLALLIMAYPSMMLLYSYSSYRGVELTVKVVGRQWYWRWEISDLHEDAVSIYMTSFDDLEFGAYRLLEVDNVLILPVNTVIQFNITRRDVIHSFALPRLGLKVDAVAGILRVLVLNRAKVGVHYGQCSEICGMGHSFIPFVVEICPFTSFIH